MWRLSARKPFLIGLLSFLVIPVSYAVSPDQKLVSLVLPDAQIVAGISAPPSLGQPDSFVIVTHKNSVDLLDFYALSGVDSSRIISQIIFLAAAGNTGGLTEHSLLVSGHFDQERIYKSATDGGASMTLYRGVRVLTILPFARERGDFTDVRWLAVLDSNILLFGTIASVQRELDRHLSGSAADPSLLRKLARMRRDDQTWCMVHAPARSAEIRDALAGLDPKLDELAQDRDTVQFGIRYTRRVEFEYVVGEPSNTAASAISDSFTQSPGKQAGGSSLLQGSNPAGDDSTVRGVIKLSITRYKEWLAEISARRQFRSTEIAMY
jgi:hypothetical protein